MITLHEIVTAAVGWTKGAPGNDWGIFAPIEGETEQEAAIREQASILAHRIDRCAPEAMVQSAAHALDELINPPATGALGADGLSYAARCAFGLGAGLVLGTMIRKSRGHLGRAVVNAAVYSTVRPAFAALIHQ